MCCVVLLNDDSLVLKMSRKAVRIFSSLTCLCLYALNCGCLSEKKRHKVVEELEAMPHSFHQIVPHWIPHLSPVPRKNKLILGCMN